RPVRIDQPELRFLTVFRRQSLQRRSISTRNGTVGAHKNQNLHLPGRRLGKINRLSLKIDSPQLRLGGAGRQKHDSKKQGSGRGNEISQKNHAVTSALWNRCGRKYPAICCRMEDQQASCSLKYSISALNLSLLKPTWFLVVLPTHRRCAFLALTCALFCGSSFLCGQSSSVPGAKAYERGLHAMETGDAATAKSAFQQAVRENPSNADAQNALGQLLLQQGNVDAAIVHLRAVTRLKPALAIGHLYLGQALSQKGSLDAAIAEFRATVRLAPQQPQAHEALARALSAQKKTGEAIAEMKKAAELSGDQPEVRDELGSLIAQNKDYSGAETEFRAALSSNPQYEPALLHLGVVLLNEGKQTEAKPLLQQAVQVKP